MPAKPYWDIPIFESEEPLVSMPKDAFVYADPHPYMALGAPYGDASPFCVREGVLAALLDAQSALQRRQPHWKLFMFDVYRPVAVQKFMVEQTFDELLQAKGLDPSGLLPAQVEALWEEVYQLWAPPNLDPKTPPPHSTGAAVDLSLFDTYAQETVFMGSPIDELSARSQPDYFGNLARDLTVATGDRNTAALAHAHRQLLYEVMHQAGFQRHPGEWWHFSLGDQMWAWRSHQETPIKSYTAKYGRILQDGE
ncbi:M15 family metallopeptidase [Altericista sp. CCNU0014]|uniref:M15 family metallopeptidase n=1 Tax=Altericista sp. CCNU0014 TaxID=3082949 RepID=UPI00384F05E4